MHRILSITQNRATGENMLTNLTPRNTQMNMISRRMVPVYRGDGGEAVVGVGVYRVGVFI